MALHSMVMPAPTQLSHQSAFVLLVLSLGLSLQAASAVAQDASQHTRQRQSLTATRLSLKKKTEPSPQTCDEDASSEFCPYDKQCKPDGDCSECPGYNQHNEAAHTCDQNPPKFVTAMCGEQATSVRKCYKFSLDLIGCMEACATKNAKALYGQCMKGLEGGCPICNCADI